MKSCCESSTHTFIDKIFEHGIGVYESSVGNVVCKAISITIYLFKNVVYKSG